MSNVVLTDREDGILTITMNRPDALNALDMELSDALNEAIQTAEQDTEIRCVVIRGGEQFMAGGDLKWFSENLVGSSQPMKLCLTQWKYQNA